MNETHVVTTTLWLWSSSGGPSSWHFLTIAGEAAEAIHATAIMRRLEGGRRRGWGSMRVQATIGDSVWDTSIFPARDAGGWLLPVKASVRTAQGLVAGDQVRVQISL